MNSPESQIELESRAPGPASSLPGKTDPSETPSGTVIGEPRRATLAFIFVTVLLDVLALGVIIPVLPKLIESFVGGKTADAAQIFGVFNTVWALMQFIFSPIMGTLSDRFGRRPVILISSFGLGFDYLLMALAPALSWLLVGRILSGITAASFTTAMAYVADVTPEEKRSASFGLLGAAWGLGFVLGPAVGGVLGGISPRLPFWVAGGLTLLNALYGLFVLPESCPTERRKAFSWKRANPIGAVVLLSSHRELLGLSAVHFLYLLAHQALPSVFVLYAGYRYGWGERDVGLLLALIGICSITVQGALVRPTVARIGERWALVAGLLFGAGVFAFYGLATAGYMLWLGAPVFALMGLFDPPLQALLTRRVDPSQQGQLQGANSSLMGITGLIGPILFTQIFAYCIKSSAGVGHWGLQLPGAPFLLGAALLLSAIVVAWYVFSQPADSN